MTSPLVSVVVLSHRWRTHPAMVDACLHSVREQTYPRLQVMVQFCESRWNTKLNDAVNATKGEAVVIVCDDDLLDPEYVARCVEVLEQGADIVYTDRRAFKDGEPPASGVHFRQHGEMYQGQRAYWIHMLPSTFGFGSSLPMTCLIHRDWWNKLQGHDPEMPHSDTEFWYRSIREGAKTGYIPEPLFLYREHPEQFSRTHDAMWSAMRAFHRKHFLDFGVLMTTAVATGHHEMQVHGLIHPWQRYAYQATHFTPLTTTGYMATQKMVLPKTIKAAITLQREKAQREIDALIEQAFTDVQLNLGDGWRLNEDLDAVRELPEEGVAVPPAEGSGPKLVTDEPASPASLASPTSSPTYPVAESPTSEPSTASA